MLTIIRRGPASAAASIFSSSLRSQCARNARPRCAQQHNPQIAHSLTVRSFGATPSWRRSAATNAAYEDEAIEGDIEQEVYAEEPPSDAQIKRATNHGPVTKFAELAERGMVCQTVVDTITQDMGLETMTQVQSLTINESLKGIDM